MKRFKDIIWAILHPGFWIMNYPYSAEWDRILNEAMANNKFIPIDKCHAKLGESILWVENYPYAAFGSPGVEFHPARRTISKAMKKLIIDSYGG